LRGIAKLLQGNSFDRFVEPIKLDDRSSCLQGQGSRGVRMAGLKKKKKEKTGSPNLALVIFLILFVITSITLGAMLYYAYDEKNDAKIQRQKLADKEKADKDHIYYLEMLVSDGRLALGDTPGK